MADLGVKDHQARFVSIEDVGIVLRADMHACKVAAGACLTLKALDDLSPHVLAVEPLGLVLGRASDVGLEVVPVLAGAR